MRALEIFSRVPPGCVLHLQDDGSHEPHVHTGEWAVVDPTDTNVVTGELYLIGWPRCPRQSKTIMQVVLCRYGDGSETVSLMPLNRPQSKAELQEWLRSRRPIYMGESGLGIEHLPKYVRGRVVGIYQAAEAVQLTLPAPTVR